jgi:hypothetical protein
MFACAVPALVAPATSAPIPAFDPNSVNTAIALTANSAGTQTAVMAPPSDTPTVTPTRTSLPTLPSTPTFIFILATATVPSATPTLDTSSTAPQFACRVDSQTPPDKSIFVQGSSFNASWLVTNIGTTTWDSNSSDYRYVKGDKIYLTPIYDFNKSVSQGQQISFNVGMRAPSSPGTYSTRWNISIGRNKFCQMNLTIIVH